MALRWILVFVVASCFTEARVSYDKFHVTFNTKQNGKVSLSYTFSQQQGLTKADKQAVLNIHNALRNKLALGKQSSMPPASNMLAMDWDDRLAAFAQDWANRCRGKHSDLKVPGAAFTKDNFAENICGDYAAIERDMYGEVKDWNYRTQNCRPNAQCGHYVTVASWSHFRIGCGWKVCSSGITKKLMLYCVFAPYSSGGLDLEGERRAPEQYEYKEGRPCSDCPQGWDFCLGGGLCATKKQCESDPRNKCRCLNRRSECVANGGRFIAAKCQCRCPANRYGINCKNACRNPSGFVACGMTCGNSIEEILNCHQSCGGCGKSTSPGYKYYMERHPAVNSEGIKTACYVNDPSVPRNPNLSSLPSYGKCTNREFNQFCEQIRLRHYCIGALDGARWKHYCSLSCNSCGSTAWSRQIQAATQNANSGSTGDSGSSGTSDSGWTNAGGDSSDSGWTNTGSAGGSSAGSSGSGTSDGDGTNAGNAGSSSAGNAGSGTSDGDYTDIGGGGSSGGGAGSDYY